MKNKNKMIVLSIGFSLSLGGCGDMGNSNGNNNEDNKNLTKEEKHDKERYVSVQDYTGQGYETLEGNGEEEDKIAEANRETVHKAVKEFFLNDYKTEVKVHNIVGAEDAAIVFVESIGEPHFYTYALVPVDVDQEKVLADQIWSQEGQVEEALTTSIFAMIHDKEVTKLSNYLEGIVEEYPVVGKQMEALQNVGADGYGTPYFFISSLDPAFEVLYNSYLDNPDITKEELKEKFSKLDYPPKGLIFAIKLYMEEPNTEPSKEIFNKIVSDLEEMDGLARGSYAVYLNDNRVDKTTAIGTKDNTLERANPNYIIQKVRENL
ncbi:DUF1672 domain-containing protein [Pseudalkalibacillus decolorationis]|uniref:DUF1672 domain-containing protein n=1 Tax=Pseudalkalibacillus decolorationis TaxID=163879 RepID=UPI002148638A|nr:DUF1672 domain-containing protein [Pseudalkalibacillus decolorationis]